MDFTLKMNIRHPGQLKKLKSWGPFSSYQVNSTASKLGQIDQIGSAQNGPQDFDFSTAMGAKPTFCMTFIAT